MRIVKTFVNESNGRFRVTIFLKYILLNAVYISAKPQVKKAANDFFVTFL